MFVNYECFDEIDIHELSLCYVKLKFVCFFRLCECLRIFWNCFFYYSFMQCNLDFLFRQFVLVCCIKHLCIFDTLFLVVRNNTLFLVVRNNILRIWSYQYTGLASFLNWFRIHSPTLYQVEDEEEEEICWYWRYLLSWLVNWFKRNGLESACFYFSVFRLSWFNCQIPMV